MCLKKKVYCTQLPFLEKKRVNTHTPYKGYKEDTSKKKLSTTGGSGSYQYVFFNI